MSWIPDWITGYDAENAARARAADDEIRRMNAAKIASGEYTAAQAAAIQKDFSTDASFATDEAARQTIDQQFAEGAADGLKNVKSAVNSTALGFLGAIPAAVWIILAVALFVWLGGIPALRGGLTRRLSAKLA